MSSYPTLSRNLIVRLIQNKAPEFSQSSQKFPKTAQGGLS